MTRPLVMGILNVTPNSFSDGGQYDSVANAVLHARKLLVEGADWIDIGGEATNPGAAPIDLQEEMARVLPAIDAIRAHHPHARLSVDTQKPGLMTAAILRGVGMINDVNGFQAEGAFEAVAKSPVEIVIMHRQGCAQTMQLNPHYTDVVQEIYDFLEARVACALEHGIDLSRIWIDPGFGFGKNVEHNLTLLRHLHRFRAITPKILVGLSRKHTLGVLTGRPPEDRVAATVTAHLLAMHGGARMIRVHDVAEAVDSIQLWEAYQGVEA